MDGQQVAQALRERSSQERLKMVALSGSEIVLPDDALFDCYLLKPVKLETLLGFVDCSEPVA